VTTTNTVNNAAETVVDVISTRTKNPNAPLYQLTPTDNAVEHINHRRPRRPQPPDRHHDGHVWAVPADPSLPGFTGKFASWDGVNATNKVVNTTATFPVQGAGSDGSAFSFHDTQHLTTTPTAAALLFTYCHD
jgi:hypothetical protein